MTLSEHQVIQNERQCRVQTPLASYQAWNKSLHKCPDTGEHIFYNISQQSSLPWPLLVQNKYNWSFNKPTGCGNIPNSIQIDGNFFEKMDTNVFDFSYLERKSRSSKTQNAELSGLHHHTKFQKIIALKFCFLAFLWLWIKIRVNQLYPKSWVQ